MNKQEHVNEYTVQTCINSSLHDLSQLTNNSMKVNGLSFPVIECACADKMWKFIRIFLRILPVATSAHPHFTPRLTYLHCNQGW